MAILEHMRDVPDEITRVKVCACLVIEINGQPRIIKAVLRIYNFDALMTRIAQVFRNCSDDLFLFFRNF